MYNNISNSASASYTQDAGLKRYFRDIYMNVALGIGIVAACCFAVEHMSIVRAFVMTPLVVFGSAIGLMGLSFYMPLNAHRLPAQTLSGLFFTVAVLEGILVSLITSAYLPGSVFKAFATAAITFWIASEYAKQTNTDLRKFSSLMTTVILGVIITSIINLFTRSHIVSLGISAISVVLFTALIARDTQELEQLYYNHAAQQDKVAILGSLQLFLSIIGLFVHLLRLMGTRRNNT